MDKQLILLCGYPASGKSTYSTTLDNACIISRDKLKGSYKTMLNKLEAYKTEKLLVLDNTFLTNDSREPFIVWGKNNGYAVNIVLIESSIEDCQIRHLIRMLNIHRTIYYRGDGPRNDPSMYGPVVLFRARKQFEKPKIDNSITIINQPHPYSNTDYKKRALFLDLDGTLQNYDTKELFTEAELMKQKLSLFSDIPLIVVTNQSGIYKGTTTFDEINKQIQAIENKLDVKFMVHICPHKSAPIECFCRKPQVGFAVEEIERLKLNPRSCIMVGDKTTDKTFALRVGMQFIKPEDFWKQD